MTNVLDLKMPVRTVGPANPAVDFDTMKSYLRVDTDEQDAIINKLITWATEACQNFTGRSLINQTWRLDLNCFPSWSIPLRFPPLVAVTGIQYFDSSGALQTLDPTEYQVDITSEPGEVRPAPHTTWPSTQSDKVNAVAITYSAGYGATYESVPEELQMGIMTAVAEVFEDRTRMMRRSDAAEAFWWPLRVL